MLTIRASHPRHRPAFPGHSHSQRTPQRKGPSWELKVRVHVFGAARRSEPRGSVLPLHLGPPLQGAPRKGCRPTELPRHLGLVRSYADSQPPPPGRHRLRPPQGPQRGSPNQRLPGSGDPWRGSSSRALPHHTYTRDGRGVRMKRDSAEHHPRCGGRRTHCSPLPGPAHPRGQRAASPTG